LTSRRDAATVLGMMSVRWTAVILSVLLTLVLCGLVLPVSAHPGFRSDGMASELTPVSAGPAAPPSILTASPTPAGLPGLACVGALLVALVTWRRRRRRAVAAILMLLLVILAYEDGLHSVHHGPAPQAADSCPTLAVSAHAVGTEVETSCLATPMLVVLGPALPIAVYVPADHVPRPDQGRAPPASPSSL
jgi:hypothetical protein